MMACRRTFQMRADLFTSSSAKISELRSLEVIDCGIALFITKYTAYQKTYCTDNNRTLIMN